MLADIGIVRSSERDSPTTTVPRGPASRDKKRRESFEMYDKGGRPISATERAEVEALGKYLPARWARTRSAGPFKPRSNEGATNVGAVMGRSCAFQGSRRAARINAVVRDELGQGV
jgi:uncharacterized protein YqeY